MDEIGEAPRKPRGRPRRYAEYDDLLAKLPPKMAKRPKYVNGIGVFRGERETTIWIKFTLPRGGSYKGRIYQPGEAAEIKLGKQSSWTWPQAEAERNRLVGRAERGEPLEDAPVVRFNTYATNWLASRQGVVKNWKTELGTLKNSLLPFFGEMNLSAITFQDVNRWQAKRLEAGQAPATVQRQLNTLKTIFNDGKRAGRIERNPCDDAQKLKGIEPRQTFLEIDEAARLVGAAAEIADWLPDFLVWLLHSGMRRGEALALTWEQIRKVGDITAVSIQRTKSGKPRTLTCTPDMSAILERRRKARPDHEKVFPIPQITLKRKLKLLRERTGLDFWLHDLRRTNATHLYRAGVDLRTLAARIGHADLSMLQKVYAVYKNDDPAREKAQSVFGGLMPEDKSAPPSKIARR